MTTSFDIHGHVLPGFERVREVFAANFAHRGEQGAAVAFYQRGVPVVDLWGGFRCIRSRDPWTKSTLVLTYSVTKGIAAAVLAVAHSRGWFDLEEPVCRYWPEFAHAGKEQITVRQLLTHQAGLVALDSRRVPQSMHDLDALSDLLARQRPVWKPGSRHGYHTLTLGWYQSELLRRVDPQRRSLGAFLQEEIAAPLGVEYYIGVPDDISNERMAVIEGFGRSELVRHFHELPIGMVIASLWPGSYVSRSVRNLPFANPAELGGEKYRHIEIPSANGIGTARAIAKIYTAMLGEFEFLGLASDTLALLTEPPRIPTLGARDAVLHIPTRYTFGLSRPGPVMRFGTSEQAFGAFGAGGAFGFADPSTRCSYAYVTNKMGFRLFDDRREKAVREACFDCMRAL
jgi:CubicO group peptidase (beta-lactamase class C family)